MANLAFEVPAFRQRCLGSLLTQWWLSCPLLIIFHPFSSLLYRFSSLHILSTRLALPESLSFSTWMMMVPAFPSSLDPPLWRLGTRIKRYTVKRCKKPNPRHIQHIQHSSLLCRCPMSSMSSCFMASRRIGNRAWRCLIRHKPETDRRAWGTGKKLWFHWPHADLMLTSCWPPCDSFPDGRKLTQSQLSGPSAEAGYKMV